MRRDVAIRVENLGKRYRIGQQRESYKSLRESLVNAAAAPFHRLRGEGEERKDTFWALKDVSFEVKHGEVVGIIGRNGAGKSTLLKLLTRITDPTAGRVELNGRVASLLEVGTGFHPELTGRENIYMNGAILGMTKREIASKFDEIVAFAEIEKFLDTPVKRYSSGMYVRLAFAVAAHLEPEILLVDEVLAVGDARFQQKCLGKMGEVAKNGRTVLFVSHNMAAVQYLCSRGIALNSGTLILNGEIHSAIYCYMRLSDELILTQLDQRTDRIGTQDLKFTKITIVDNQYNEISEVLSGQDIFIRFYFKTTREWDVANVVIACNFQSSKGYIITNLNNIDTGNDFGNIPRDGYFECAWPHLNLRADIYNCALYCTINGIVVDWLQSAFRISVTDGDFFNTGKIVGRDGGDIFVDHKWCIFDNNNDLRRNQVEFTRYFGQ